VKRLVKNLMARWLFGMSVSEFQSLMRELKRYRTLVGNVPERKTDSPFVRVGFDDATEVFTYERHTP